MPITTAVAQARLWPAGGWLINLIQRNVGISSRCVAQSSACALVVGAAVSSLDIKLIIGVVVGIGTALALKYILVRRFPKIESCLIILIAYVSYFFSNGVHMSGKYLRRSPADGSH